MSSRYDSFRATSAAPQITTLPKVLMQVRECVLHQEAEESSHMGLAHLWYVLEWERCQYVPNKLNEVYIVNSTEGHQV
ncbi:hypothetical protein DSO57_1033543 [Entomophthora muscae]|uniref:Uncharacterized protein n=1 Tax=Entomophthora muscae TaxID=34485 RepID=A0ACC2TY66_9FUNG|nr:hypothetical protein DSO57_1033543 [Entomophthora muscae]